MNCEIGNSTRSILSLDSDTFTHSQQSKIAQDNGLTCDVEKIPKRYILARAMPLYTRSRYDFSYRPLQYDIWCLVIDPVTKKREFQLLSQCQERMRSQQIVYEDRDLGRGIHPKADVEWMTILKLRELWSEDVYEVRDVVCLQVKRKEYTVFLWPTEKKRKLLMDIREQYGYICDDLVRVPISLFPENKREALKKMAHAPYSCVAKEPTN